MSKYLVIVESPSKAKTINRYLGKDFIVKATVGHIKNLPKSKISVDIENGYVPSYETISGKEKVIKELKSSAQNSDKIYIATDPDREGEAIAADIADIVSKINSSIHRVLFNEITKSGVEHAMKNPRAIEKNIVSSQIARRVMDRLLGYKLSPFLWKTFYFGLSAGRVQSVALKLICEREKEIKDFKPKEYWSIHSVFSKPSGHSKSFAAKLYKIDNDILKFNGDKPCIENIDQAHKIIEELKGNKFKITDIHFKTVKRNPPVPFITSVLQQTASTRLGFSPKKTMTLAQKLYEGIEVEKGEGNVGLITYMRTDSTRVSPEAVSSTRDFIKNNYGKEYLPEKTKVFASKGKIHSYMEKVCCFTNESCNI
jgi:DNA topoisomerase-1